MKTMSLWLLVIGSGSSEVWSNRKTEGRFFPPRKKTRGRSLSLGSRHYSGGEIDRCETVLVSTLRDAMSISAWSNVVAKAPLRSKISRVHCVAHDEVWDWKWKFTENWGLNEMTRLYNDYRDCVAGTEMTGLENCREAETGVQATQGDVESRSWLRVKTSC
jgi:hypothetical protein